MSKKDVESREYAAASDNGYHHHDAYYVSLLYMYCFMKIPLRAIAMNDTEVVFFPFRARLSLLRLFHVLLAFQCHCTRTSAFLAHCQLKVWSGSEALIIDR